MRKAVVLGLLAILLASCFVGCDVVNSLTTYTVRFDSNGGSNVAAITGIASGSTVTLPGNPFKANNTFAGWFIDNGTFQNQFTSSTVITSNLTVYAKWTYTGPKSVKITGLNSFDGKYGAVVVFSNDDGNYFPVANSRNYELITSGAFTINLWKDDLSILTPSGFTIRWSGDGEYFAYIIVDNNAEPIYANNIPISRVLFIESGTKIMIRQEETTTINISDYEWKVLQGSL